MDWPLLAGSLAAVLALAAMARWLRLGGSGPIDADALRAEIEARLIDVHVDALFVSAATGHAVAIAGSMLVLAKLGPTGPALRRLSHPVRWGEAGEALWIDSGERMFGRLRLLLPPEERRKLLTMM